MEESLNVQWGSKLDIETIEKMVDEFNKQKIELFEFIPHKLLPNDTIIKDGNKIYFPPNIKEGEVKVIILPEIKQDEFKISF
jgi:hypothetical protein